MGRTGYLCYCNKQNGIRVENGKQGFICSQNPFLHASSISKGIFALCVYAYMLLLHSVSVYSFKYILFMISSFHQLVFL